MDLATPLENFNRVGKTLAARLKTLGLNTAEDLLFYPPFRYDNFGEVKKIKDLIAGDRANIIGTIELISNKRSHRRRMNITEALISDDTDSIKAIWFNQPFLTKNLKMGDEVSLAGKVDEELGGLVLVSPVYEKAGRGSLHTQGLVPNYSLTAGLTQKQLRFLISQAISLAKNLTDWLPPEIRQANNLLNLDQAIYQIHFPKNQHQVDEAKQRLGFDELFLMQVKSQLLRAALQQKQAPALEFKQELTKNFVDNLNFKLTDDQKKSAWEIIQDLSRAKPMTRLLEGDVGSGKTMVALLAALNASANYYQVAFMVPSEILARQHFQSLSKLLNKNNLIIGLITSSAKKFSDDGIKKINADYIAQNADIIIGTHALIQEKINFKKLGLVIVDEQHRFGVNQRQALMTKANLGENMAPHLLSMTATPIPRSLALALYDDLSLSIIKQMPDGRQPIITNIFSEEERASAYKLISEQINQGRQAFIICPLIESETPSQPPPSLGGGEVKSVLEEFANLTNIFKDYKVGLIHGKLKPKIKDEVMTQFAGGEIQILVATSVVEVGIDVPNATVMLIENADRFGLAQLHQYRGRVGRGEHQSYCLLAATDASDKARQRLDAMLEFNNGFDLAQADLKFRGPGEVYGTVQKGWPELKIASLFDYVLMKQARESAQKIINLSPDLAKFPALKQKIGDNQKNPHLE